MINHHSDYRDLIGYEDMYKVNRFCKIKHKKPTILCRGVEVPSHEHKPIIEVRGKTTYAIIRDEKFKRRKINVSRMVVNIFGRQRPVEINKNKPIKDFVKPINKRGRRGIPVEQYENGKLVGTFETFAAAAKAVSGSLNKISDAAHGVIKHYAGYKWKIKSNNKNKH